MDSQSDNTKRIAKNTMMLYIRMLFGMLVSLYTSRIVLQTLGVEDYGIYNVVGGFVSMFSLLSGSLSTAVSRFLTFELGKKNIERLKRVFSTSFLIHLGLALLIVFVAESIGLWFLNNYMVIPSEREAAAFWVYQASVLSFVLGMICVPFNAVIVSHERMSAFAFIGILDIFFRLIIVLFIAYAPLIYDKLIVYALLLVLESFLFQGMYVLYCIRHFEECHYYTYINKSTVKEMFGFAGWNFIGSSSALLRDQGGNVLLNLFGGPYVNAARGIATSVNVAICGFVNNFMIAVNPQITKSYAVGDHDYMIDLIYKASRFSYYLLFLLSLPILFNTDYILFLWLGIVPEHVVLFVQLILIFALCESISNPLVTAMLATGKIRNYQLIVGGLQMLNLPVSYILLKQGAFPEVVLIVAIVISVCCLTARLFLLRGLIGLSTNHFCKQIVLNVVYVTFFGSIIPFLVTYVLKEGFVSFLISCIVCFLSVVLSVLYLGCSLKERNFVLAKIKAKLM